MSADSGNTSFWTPLSNVVQMSSMYRVGMFLQECFFRLGTWHIWKQLPKKTVAPLCRSMHIDGCNVLIPRTFAPDRPLRDL